MAEIADKFHSKFKEFLDDGKQELKKIKSPKDLVKQIPNVFTVSRLFLIPFIIGNILSGNMILAGALTIAASATDLVDGKIARRLDATSEFGANLDALIDKIFITSVSIPLFFHNPSLVLPFTLDLIIAGINGYSHIQGYESKTNSAGKAKTVFLDSLIVSSFFTEYKLFNYISKGLLLPTVLLQTYAASEYYNSYKQQKKRDDMNKIFKSFDRDDKLAKTNEKEKDINNKTLNQEKDINDIKFNEKKSITNKTLNQEKIEDLKKLQSYLIDYERDNQFSEEKGYQKVMKKTDN